MKNSFKSLFASLSIHIALLAALLYGYQLFHHTFIKSPQKSQKRLAVNLDTLSSCVKTKQQSKATVKQQPKVMKQPKQIKKIEKIKKHHKKELKKKIVKKRVKKKKILKRKKKIHKTDKQLQQKKNNKKVQDIKQIKRVEHKVANKVKEKQTLQKKQQQADKACKKTQQSVDTHYINNNLQRIQQILKENLYYPRKARKRGIEGEVVVRFVLKKDATITNIKILNSSNAILSRAAKRTLEDLSGNFPKPSQKLTITLPIEYTLE